jgi:hypothetical protein
MIFLGGWGDFWEIWQKGRAITNQVDIEKVESNSPWYEICVIQQYIIYYVKVHFEKYLWNYINVRGRICCSHIKIKICHFLPLIQKESLMVAYWFWPSICLATTISIFAIGIFPVSKYKGKFVKQSWCI